MALTPRPTADRQPRNRAERRDPESWLRLDQLLEARPWLTERWVRRMVAERRIPFSKVGGGPKARLLFNLSDVDAMVEAGCVEAAR